MQTGLFLAGKRLQKTPNSTYRVTSQTTMRCHPEDRAASASRFRFVFTTPEPRRSRRFFTAVDGRIGRRNPGIGGDPGVV